MTYFFAMSMQKLWNAEYFCNFPFFSKQKTCCFAMYNVYCIFISHHLFEKKSFWLKHIVLCVICGTASQKRYTLKKISFILWLKKKLQSQTKRRKAKKSHNYYCDSLFSSLSLYVHFCDRSLSHTNSRLSKSTSNAIHYS